MLHIENAILSIGAHLGTATWADRHPQDRVQKIVNYVVVKTNQEMRFLWIMIIKQMHFEAGCVIVVICLSDIMAMIYLDLFVPWNI